jgi:hypothetical protein
MFRKLVLAAALAAVSAAPAFAQRYPAAPPPDYMRAPPAAWQNQDFWRHMDHRHQQAYFDQWRRESWRCDHGDRAACNWLHHVG